MTSLIFWRWSFHGWPTCLPWKSHICNIPSLPPVMITVSFKLTAISFVEPVENWMLIFSLAVAIVLRSSDWTESITGKNGREQFWPTAWIARANPSGGFVSKRFLTVAAFSRIPANWAWVRAAMVSPVMEVTTKVVIPIVFFWFLNSCSKLSWTKFASAQLSQDSFGWSA